MSFNKNITKSLQWILRHGLVVVICVAICALGTVYLAYSSTTTIGEDISTTNLTVSGTLEAKTGRTATLVVAANDSSTTGKAQADYVCDGIDDQVQIQTAIDSATNSAKIQLLEGNFYISSTINLDKNLHIEGAGNVVTILHLADSADTDMFHLTGHSVLPYFGHMKIYGNKANQGVETHAFVQTEDSAVDITFHDIWFSSWSGSVIVLRQYWDHHISRCVFEHNDGYGISFEPLSSSKVPTNTWITENFFMDTKGAIYTDGNATVTQLKITNNQFLLPNEEWTKDMIVLNNTNIIQINNNIFSGGIFGTLDSGITIENSDYIIISNNIFGGFNGSGSHPIRFIGTDTISNILIANNLFHENWGNSIQNDIPSTSKLLTTEIRDNIFSSGKNIKGIVCGRSDYLRIEGNRFQGFGDNFDVCVDISATHCWYPIVGDNYFSECTTAISDSVDESRAPRIARNIGYATENSGSATISSGTTYSDASHGLDITPSINDISIIVTTSMGSASTFWTSDVDSDSFRINVDQNPTQDVGFSWQIGNY